MNRLYFRSCCAAALLFPVLGTAAQAALIAFTGTSSDGHAVSATVDFTLAAGTATVILTNTTATTHDAGELFTGIDFNFGGLTPSLTSKTGIQRTVTGSGSFTDTPAVQDLSWSLSSLGSGAYELNFNPNAKDAIIAPPSGSDYSGANGSIKGNAGHNPFAAVSATFVLSVPGLLATSPVSLTTLRFGTSLDPATGTIIVPEPTCLVLTLAATALLAYRRRR